MLPPCSLLFSLFSFILEYLRVDVDLVWICFLSFHLHFPKFFYLLSISEKSLKIKFLGKFQKILFKFLCQNGAERHLGHLKGTHHATTWWRGQDQATPWHGVGPPGPPLTSPPSTSFSLPKYLHFIAQTRVLAVRARDFRSP
jgi:hypothetical protein